MTTEQKLKLANMEIKKAMHTIDKWAMHNHEMDEIDSKMYVLKVYDRLNALLEKLDVE